VSFTLTVQRTAEMKSGTTRTAPCDRFSVGGITATHLSVCAVEHIDSSDEERSDRFEQR
jgi:hypothetical protein